MYYMYIYTILNNFWNYNWNTMVCVYMFMYIYIKDDDNRYIGLSKKRYPQIIIGKTFDIKFQVWVILVSGRPI